MKNLYLILCVLFFSQTLLYADDQLTESSSSFPAVPHIMGGYEAPSGAWPWMTAILYADESDLYSAQYCGGVLIASNWVLTAGHCVDGKSASDIQVAVGVHDLSNWSGTRIPVKRIVSHPAYVNYLANDIALLELSSASGQQPIAIFSGASVQGIDPKLLNQMTTLVGWGLVDTETSWYYPEKLQQVNLPVIADSYCNSGYGVTLSDSQLCAGYAVAKDVCTGDSGGPMMLMVDGQWVHVGLVSFGADCEVSNGYYGVYTRSSEFVAFIKQYVPAAKFTTGAITTKSFPWPMFLPALSRVGTCGAQKLDLCRSEADCLKFHGYWYDNSCHQSITCSDIAGKYSGDVSDSCPGYWVTDKVDISITSNCSLSGTTYQYGTYFYGTITNRQGNVFSASEQTDASGCGKFALTCTNNGTSDSCNYQYANGKTGFITNVVFQY